MADEATPLFVPEKEELLRSLRLGKLIDRDAGMAVVNDAIRSSWIALVSSIPASVVSTILAVTPTPQPSTPGELQRMIAQALETAMVRWECIKNMPLAFLDASGGMPDWYEHEAPYRLTNASERSRLIAELRNEIQRLAGQLCDPRTESEKACITLGAGGMSAVVLGDVRDDWPDVTCTSGVLNQKHYCSEESFWKI